MITKQTSPSLQATLKCFEEIKITAVKTRGEFSHFFLGAKEMQEFRDHLNNLFPVNYTVKNEHIRNEILFEGVRILPSENGFRRGGRITFLGGDSIDSAEDYPFEECCGRCIEGMDECVPNQKQTYRILDVGEKIQEGDEANMVGVGEGWQPVTKGLCGCTVSDHANYMPHGYYRRPVTASSDNHAEHVQAHLTLAIKEQEAEIKKLKSDLFAYGEFTTNVAKALGMGTYEISFKEVLEEIGNLKKSRLMCGCSELIREITKRENTSPEVKNWEQVAKAFENEVARQADYIEALERDLRSESGWKDLLAIRDKRIEDLVELCHKESASAEEAWQKAERFEDCLNQVAVILGPKTTIHDDGFTDGEPTCYRVVEVLTERILRLWKLEAANDNAH